jgi:hypothetical protein
MQQSTSCVGLFNLQVLRLFTSGHDRSVEEVVNTASKKMLMPSLRIKVVITIDKYMYDLLQEKGAGQIKIFGVEWSDFVFPRD